MDSVFYPKTFLQVTLLELIVVVVMSSCLKLELDPMKDKSPSGTIWRLDKNIEGLRSLAEACMRADSIAIFDVQYLDDGSVLYWMKMKETRDIELFSEIVSESVIVPELSMEQIEDTCYWTVNGAFLLDVDRNRVSVTDLSKDIHFILRNDSVICTINGSDVEEYPATKADYLSKDVRIDFDVEKRAFSFNLSSGFRTVIPTISEFGLLESRVQNRSFYKDVFLDAGVSLNSRKTLPAARYLGLSLEGIDFPVSNATAADKVLQTSIVSGNSMDYNGRLLYPDGQPRFRLLYVNGGNSTTHGQSLGDKGLENMRRFVNGGGSYLGICAGAFMASNGYDGKSDYPYYLSLWPGMMKHTRLYDSRFGVFIENDSALLQYDDFGGDYYVDSVYHSSGGYPVDMPSGTEVLARYDYQKRKDIHNKPSMWAYKASIDIGRIVLSGSHPESYVSGDRLKLTAAMLQYAMDGVGTVSLKGYLKNGGIREMDKTTEDNDPDYTRIGDLQTHHFATYIPSDAKNIRVELSSSSECDFVLMMNQGTYAFSDSAEYSSSGTGPEQQLFFPYIKEGFWFIGVKCLTTVTVEETDYGQAYSGHTEVLNGVPYTISISWE